MFSVQKKIKNSEHYTVMKGRTASTAVKNITNSHFSN